MHACAVGRLLSSRDPTRLIVKLCFPPAVTGADDTALLNGCDAIVTNPSDDRAHTEGHTTRSLPGLLIGYEYMWEIVGKPLKPSSSLKPPAGV